MSDQNWNPTPPQPQQPQYPPQPVDPYAAPNPAQFAQDPNPYGQLPLSAPSATDPASQQYGQLGYGQPQQDPFAGYQQQQPYGNAQVGPQPDPYAYQQYAQANAQAPRPVGDDNFFTALFDFSFTKYVTPVVVKVLYILIIVAIVLLWLVQTWGAFQWTPALGIVTFLVGAVFALGGIALARVSLETSVALIRVAQHSEKIKNTLESSNSTDA